MRLLPWFQDQGGSFLCTLLKNYKCGSQLQLLFKMKIIIIIRVTKLIIIYETHTSYTVNKNIIFQKMYLYVYKLTSYYTPTTTRNSRAGSTSPVVLGGSLTALFQTLSFMSPDPSLLRYTLSPSLVFSLDSNTT